MCAPVFFDYDARRISKQNPCARCGRRIEPGQKRVWVRIKSIKGAPHVISPTAHLADPTEDLQPLGMNCARRFGPAYYIRTDIQE